MYVDSIMSVVLMRVASLRYFEYAICNLSLIKVYMQQNVTWKTTGQPDPPHLVIVLVPLRVYLIRVLDKSP